MPSNSPEKSKEQLEAEKRLKYFKKSHTRLLLPGLKKDRKVPFDKPEELDPGKEKNTDLRERINKVNKVFGPSRIYPRAVIHKLAHTDLIPRLEEKHDAKDQRAKLPPERDTQITMVDEVYKILEAMQITPAQYAEYLEQMNVSYADGSYKNHDRLKVSLPEFKRLLPKIKHEWPQVASQMDQHVKNWAFYESRLASAKKEFETAKKAYEDCDELIKEQDAKRAEIKKCNKKEIELAEEVIQPILDIEGVNTHPQSVEDVIGKRVVKQRQKDNKAKLLPKDKEGKYTGELAALLDVKANAQAVIDTSNKEIENRKNAYFKAKEAVTNYTNVLGSYQYLDFFQDYKCVIYYTNNIYDVRSLSLLYPQCAYIRSDTKLFYMNKTLGIYEEIENFTESQRQTFDARFKPKPKPAETKEEQDIKNKPAETKEEQDIKNKPAETANLKEEQDIKYTKDMVYISTLIGHNHFKTQFEKILNGNPERFTGAREQLHQGVTKITDAMKPLPAPTIQEEKMPSYAQQREVAKKARQRAMAEAAKDFEDALKPKARQYNSDPYTNRALQQRVTTWLLDQRVREKFEVKKDKMYYGAWLYIQLGLILKDYYNNNKSNAMGNFIYPGSVAFRGIYPLLANCRFKKDELPLDNHPWLTERFIEQCLSLFKDLALHNPALFQRLTYLDPNTRQRYISAKKIQADIVSWKQQAIANPKLKATAYDHERQRMERYGVSQKDIAEYFAHKATFEAVQPKRSEQEKASPRHAALDRTAKTWMPGTMTSTDILHYVDKEDVLTQENRRTGEVYTVPAAKLRLQAFNAFTPFKNIDRVNIKYKYNDPIEAPKTINVEWRHDKSWRLNKKRKPTYKHPVFVKGTFNILDGELIPCVRRDARSNGYSPLLRRPVIAISATVLPDPNKKKTQVERNREADAAKEASMKMLDQIHHYHLGTHPKCRNGEMVLDDPYLMNRIYPEHLDAAQTKKHPKFQHVVMDPEKVRKVRFFGDHARLSEAAKIKLYGDNAAKMPDVVGARVFNKEEVEKFKKEQFKDCKFNVVRRK